MEKNDLDSDTVASIKRRIKELTDMKKVYVDELQNEEVMRKKWEAAQQRLQEFHAFCANMREKIDDPTYIIPHEKKRDACEFFGIKVYVLSVKGNPQLNVTADPPSIMSISA